MINFIIIFALLQLGFNLLFKSKNNVFGCGLFGAAADDATRINMDKLKVLGLYNDSRGGHSCGLAIDGDVIYGVDKNKMFKDFIVHNNISTPVTMPVVLGHTRMATGGTHNELNAHPFTFGENKEMYHFLGTHNGTLYNYHDLADKYGVDVIVDHSWVKGTTGKRTKIDSEIMLEIIYKEGNFNVLSEYMGAAALAMYNTKKKNTLFLYHGESLKNYSDGYPSEERPLFVYQVDSGLMYYSSIKDSLEAIADCGGEIFEVPFNTVFEIRNGNFAKAKRIPVERGNVGQYLLSTPKQDVSKETKKETQKVLTSRHDYHIGQFSGSPRNTWSPELNMFTTYEEAQKARNVRHIMKPTESVVAQRKSYNLMELADHKTAYEDQNEEKIKTSVYFENLRFWKNKELVEGVWLLDHNMNMIHVCNYLSNFKECFEQVCEEHNYIEKKHVVLLYFVKGMMLLDVKDFKMISENYNTWHMGKLSHASVYPVRSLLSDKSLAYHRGSLAQIEFCSFLGNDIIGIRNGICQSIKKKDISFENNKKYYLQEDLEIFNAITENNMATSVADIQKDVDKNEDKVVIDLYSENIIGTLDGCIEDVDDSIENVSTQCQVKSRLEKIKEIVQRMLNI